MPDSAMPDPGPHSSSEDLTGSIKSGLAELRHVLLHCPAAMSLEATGPALAQISQDLLALSQALTPPAREELREIQALNTSVQSLYRGAANFFGALSAESIKNGAWDAASYSADGEWAQPATTTRIRTQG